MRHHPTSSASLPAHLPAIPAPSQPKQDMPLSALPIVTARFSNRLSPPSIPPSPFRFPSSFPSSVLPLAISPPQQQLSPSYVTHHSALARFSPNASARLASRHSVERNTSGVNALFVRTDAEPSRSYISGSNCATGETSAIDQHEVALETRGTTVQEPTTAVPVSGAGSSKMRSKCAFRTYGLSGPNCAIGRISATKRHYFLQASSYRDILL